MAFKLFGIAKPNTYASSWHKKAEGVSDVSDSEPEPRRRQRSERNRGGGGGRRERGGEGKGTVNLSEMATHKKTKNWFSRPIIVKCRSKVLQNAPSGAFCNTFDLH